jgi:hypothetical protein
MTLTVTFLSSSSDISYHTELIGDPVRTITCTCPGYTNVKCCKHIQALLDADHDLADPRPVSGYNDALEALTRSPINSTYERLLDGLITIDEKISILKGEAKVAKKMFYRILSEGIGE